MDDKALRSFLVARPQPTKIVVKCEGDEQHELAPAGTGRTWMSIASTIQSLEPLAIALYDADGKLIRATGLSEGKASDGAAVVKPTITTSDPETLRVTHFADLLAEAYKFSTGLAFEKMVDLFSKMDDRAIALEARLERAEAQYRKAMQDRLDDAFEEAEAAKEQAEEVANDPVVGMVKQFAGGLAAGGAASSPPNGARKS